MLVTFSKPLGAMAAVFALCVSAWGQAAQAPAAKKEWKDRAEYDLYESITKTTDGKQRLELLNQWKEKYATTDFMKERLLLYLNTYQTLNQAAPMYQAAKDVVAADPADPTGLYWLNMLAPVQPGAKDNAEILSTAEKAARGLEAAFAPDKKPANVDDAKWAESGKMMSALSHKTLGWVAASRKNPEGAETELKESLKANPAQAEVAYSLGSALYSQKTKVPEALFYFARAATMEGAGALPEANKKTINDYLVKAYTGYHGDIKGLDELKSLAKANPTPPADYKLLSVTELHEMAEKDREAKLKADPQGTLWKTIKEELTGDQGPAYFDSSMKGAKPPEKSFRGKVVSATAKEIRLAMSDDTTPEATLKFETPVPKVETGTELYFTGVGQSFTKEPFMVIFDAEKTDVSGWPAPAPKPKPAKAKPRRR